MKKLALLVICVLGALSLTACPASNTTPKPESLKITVPTKTEYVVGTDESEFNLAGGDVAVRYTDGSLHDLVPLSAEGVTVSGFSAATAGPVTITVTYKNKTGTFTVNIIDVAVSSISVSTRPVKITYGTYATVEDVVRLGGELTVNYNDNSTPRIVPMTDEAVSIKSINLSAGNITVGYGGKDATYNITRVEEIANVKVSELPIRNKYRKGASALEDMDFWGGKLSLKRKDLARVEYPMDIAGRVTPKVIDTTKGYAAFDYDISFLGGEYVGVVITGYYAITPVEVWASNVVVTTNPVEDEYDPDTDGVGDVDLTGGKLTITNNDDSSGGILELPNTSKVEVKSMVLDPEDINKFIITLTYRDDVARANPLECTFKTDASEASDTVKIKYYYENLPKTTAETTADTGELDWRNQPNLTERQRDYALEALEIWTALSPADREELADEGKSIVPVAFYAWMRDIAKGWAEFYDELETLLGDQSHTPDFLNYCTAFDAQYTEFVNIFSDAKLKDVFLYKSGNNNVDVKTYRTSINNQRVTIGAYETVLGADGAADIIAKLGTLLAEDAWEIVDLAPYSVGIEAAYAALASFIDEHYDDSIATVAALYSVINGWKWDFIDILYTYYYDDADTYDKANNPEIDYLTEHSALSSLMSEVYPYLSDMMQFWSFQDRTLFLYKYDELAAYEEKIKNYEYKVTSEKLFNALELTVFTYLQENNNSVAQIVDKPVSRIISDIKSAQNEMRKNYGVWIKSGTGASATYSVDFTPAMMNFINSHGESLMKWIRPAWDYITDFNLTAATSSEPYTSADFQRTAEIFGQLRPEEQMAIMMLDVSEIWDYRGSPIDPGGVLPYFLFQMMDYFDPILREEEYTFFSAVLRAFQPLGSMALSSLGGSTLEGMPYIVQFLGVYDDIEAAYQDATGDGQAINAELMTYFGSMRNFCRSSYSVISDIDESLYGLLELMYRCQNFYRMYDGSNAPDSLAGLKFADSYKQYLAELSSVSNNNVTKVLEELDDIIFNGVVTSATHDKILNDYRESYGKWEQSQYTKAFYNDFFEISKKYIKFIQEGDNSYVKDDRAQFETDVNDLITKYLAIFNPTSLGTDNLRYLCAYDTAFMTIDIWTIWIYMVLESQPLDLPNNNNIVGTIYNCYLDYLMMHVTRGAPTNSENPIDPAKYEDAFKKSVAACKAEYAALTSGAAKTALDASLFGSLFEVVENAPEANV